LVDDDAEASDRTKQMNLWTSKMPLRGYGLSTAANLIVFITAVTYAVHMTNAPASRNATSLSTDSRHAWVSWDGTTNVVDKRCSVAGKLKQTGQRLLITHTHV